MKGKMITKVLLIVMSLILAVSIFASCGELQAEIDTVKQEVSEIESQVNGNTEKLETLETKAVVAELKALADSIKATADAAATQTALAEAIAKLEAADGESAASIQAALAEVKTALEASLKANGDADAATKAALEGAIASVKKTADAAATAVALEEVKTALEAADKAEADAAAKALAAAKKALEEAIKANSDADAAVKAELDAALAVLAQADETNAKKAADELKAAADELKATDTAAAETLMAAVAELKAIDEANKTAAQTALDEAKETLQAAVDANKENDDAVKAAIEESLAALTKADTDNAKTAQDALVEAMKTLQAAIDENSINDSGIETRLKGLISKLQEKDDKLDSAVKALDERLTKTIDTAKDELEALIAKNAEDIRTINESLEGAKAELKAADTALGTRIDGVITNLDNAKEALEAADTALGTRIDEVIADLTGTKTELEGKISTAKTELEGKINSAKTNLEAQINKNATDISSIKTSLATVEATAKAAATKTALDDAIKALQTVDAGKASNTDLENAKAALNNAIEALKNGQVTTNKGAIETLNATVSKLGETYATDKQLEDAIGVLENEAKTVSDAIANAKSAIEKDYNEQISAINDTNTGIVATVTKAYEAADEDITAKLGTIKAGYNSLSAWVNDIESKVWAAIGSETELDGLNSLAAEIKAIKADLAAVGGSIAAEVDEFVNGYELATKILQGTATVSDFKDDPDLTVDGAMTAQEKLDKYSAYTLANFSAKVNEIHAKEEWYRVDSDVSDRYDAFVATEETVRFFLTRATSVTSLEKYFADFDAAYEALPTPVESLENAVKAIEDAKSVTNDPKCYGVAKQIWEAIEKINNDGDPANDITVPDALVTGYNNIVGAHENLVNAYTAAEAVKNAINAIDATILWTDACKQEVTDARDAYNNLDDNYFKNDTYNALYTGYNAESVVTAAVYKKLTDAEARVAELTKAAEKVAEFKKHDGYAPSQTPKPLYNDLRYITELNTSVDDWKATYALEPDNVEIILGAGVDANIDSALEYATKMANIAETHDKDDALENAIAALNAANDPIVLYANKATADDLRVKLDALRKAVDGDTANLDEIIPAAIITKFVEVEAQMSALHDAYLAINGPTGFLAQMKEVALNYYNTGTMETLMTSVKLAYQATGHSIDATTDDNYIMIAKDAVDTFNEWMENYKELTSQIAKVYVALEQATAGELTLAHGNDVVTYSNMVVELQTSFGVGNTNIDLVIYPPEDPDGKNVNLKDIITRWNKFRGEFVAKAQEAQDGAVAVTEAIAGIKDLEAKDLNNYTQIAEAYEAYTGWADNYLEKDHSLEAINAVQAIQIYGQPDGTYYTFVSSDDYDTLVSQYKAAASTHATAEVKYDEIQGKFNALNNWTIYSGPAFAEAFNAYTTYIGTYYNSAIGAAAVGGAGHFGETEEKKNLDANYDKYHEALEALETAAVDVIEQIQNLMNDESDAAVLGMNLNYKGKIDNAWTAFKEWTKDFDVNLLSELQNIYKKDSNTETYTFVTVAEYAYIALAYDTAKTADEDVEASWEAVEKLFDALAKEWTDYTSAPEANEWTIHDDESFEGAEEAYKTHLDTYYGGALTENYKDSKGNWGKYGESKAYDDFMVQKNAFDTKRTAADADLNAIDDVIGTLAIDNITVDNASDYVTTVADLRAAITAYKTAYGCDLYEACAACGGISADDQLAIAKAEKVADYTVLYKAQLDLVAGDDVKVATLEGMLIDANSAMNSATFDEGATPQSVYDYAESSLNDLLAEWAASAA